MTANDFFGHFATLADAPGGIPRLRELILQSALQGKLVSQNASDEPASTLLERITSEKKRSANGKARKPHVMDDASTSGPWPLPTSWAWTCLDKIGWLNPRNDIPDETEVSFIPMALIPAEYGRAATFEKRRWGEIKSGFTHFADEDVVVAKITPCFQNGKSCVMRGLLNRAGAGTTELHVFRVVNETMDANYVLLFLKSPLFLNDGVSQMTGSAGQKRRAESLFRLVPISPAPAGGAEADRGEGGSAHGVVRWARMQQQARHAVRSRLHATLLGDLQTAANAADFARAWQRLRDHFAELFTPGEAALDAVAQLRQTILFLAYSGKLTKQNETDQDVDQTIRLIAAESCSDRTEKSKHKNEPLVHEPCEGVFAIPENWRWTRLDFLCDQIGDIDHKMPTAVDVGIPFLSAKDLKDNGVLDFSKPKFISEDDFQRLSRKILPRRNDIIYSRIGARLGKARIVEVDDRFLISYSCCLIRPKHRFVQSKYVQMFLDSHLALDQARKGTQSIGVPDLGLAEIKSYRIPFAPIEEQQRIVAKMQQLMAQCDALVASLKAAATVSERWSAAAVQRLLGQT